MVDFPLIHSDIIRPIRYPTGPMRHIRELKTRWQIRFYDASREPPEVSFSFQKHLYSRRQIQRLRDTLYVERDRGWNPWTGVLPNQQTPPSEKPTSLLRAVESYCRAKRLRGQRGQKGGWSEGTYKNYRTTLRGFAQYVGSGRQVVTLTTGDIEKWIFRDGLSQESSRTYYRMMRTFIGYLREERLADVEMPEALRRRSTIKPYFTESELEATCQAHERLCQERVDKKHAPKTGASTGRARLWMSEAFRLAFYQGLRRGELLALRRGAVDLPGRRMRIGDEAFIPKGQHEQIIPITRPALPLLENACRGKQAKDRLFPYDSPGRLTAALKAAALEAAPTKTGLDFKALRRSCGYYWAERGVSPWDIKDLLRHKSITTTEQYYVQQVARGQQERFDQAMERASTLLESGILETESVYSR